jgi:hypothetical protein
VAHGASAELLFHPALSQNKEAPWQLDGVQYEIELLRLASFHTHDVSNGVTETSPHQRKGWPVRPQIET